MSRSQLDASDSQSSEWIFAAIDYTANAMATPTLIGPIARSTRSERSASRSRHDLPADLLREASNRLSITALVGGTLWLVGWSIGHLISRPLSHDHRAIKYLYIPDFIAAGVVVMSLALSVYARKSKRDPRFILDLGLAYLVSISFAMGQTFHWAPLPTVEHVAPMISWIGPLMLLFAAVLPSTPGRTLVAGLFAASMNPLGMVIAKARGNWDFGPMSNALVMHYPDYLIVGLHFGNTQTDAPKTRCAKTRDQVKALRAERAGLGSLSNGAIGVPVHALSFITHGRGHRRPTSV